MYRMLDWDHLDARPVDAARVRGCFLRRAADVGLFDEHNFSVYYEETDWLIRRAITGSLPAVEAVEELAVRSLPTQPPASRKATPVGAMTAPGLLREDTESTRSGRADARQRRRSNAFASTFTMRRPGHW